MRQAQRFHVIYEGKVQGVGFRFTAERLAWEKGITGYVKNLPDGRVEIVCEGPEEDISSFLRDIELEMSSYIADSKKQQMPSSGEFSSFGIRF